MNRFAKNLIRASLTVSVLLLMALPILSHFSGQLAPTSHAATNVAIPAQSYVWISGDSNWDNPANWSPNGIPGPGDTAILNSDNRVFLNSDQTVGTFIMSAGQLRGTHTLTTTDAFTWSRGFINFGAGVLAPVGSVVTINGTADKSVGSGGAGNGFLTINGTGSVSGSGLGVGNSGVLLVNGTLDIADTTINGDSLLRVAAGGTLNKTGSGTTAINSLLENSGTVNVPAGVLSLGNGGTNSNASSYALGTGATLRFAGGTHIYNAAVSITGGGAVEVSGGNTYFYAGASAMDVASFTINGGGFGPGANVTLPTGATFTFSSGDLFGSNGASLIADGPATFSGGRIYFGGKLTLGVHGVMTINNASPIVVGAGQQGDGKLNILGTATVTGAGGFSINNSAELNVSGTLTLATEADFNGGDSFVNVLPGGLIHRTTGGGTTNVNPAFINNGTVDFDSGTLTLNSGGGSSSPAAFAFAPGTTLRFGGGTHVYSGAVNFTGGGAVEVSGGNTYFYAGASAMNVASFTINGGGFGPSANVTLPTGAAFTFSSGDLFGSNGASLIVDGPATFSGGRIYFGGKLTLGVHGVMTINNASPIVVGAGQQGDGKLNILGTATVTGAGGFSINNSAELNVSGTLTLATEADFNGGDSFVNVLPGGLIHRTTGGGTTNVNPAFINNGTVDFDSGTLTLNSGGGSSSPAAFAFAPGTTLRFGGGTHVYSGAVNFTGGGAVEVSGGNTYFYAGASAMNVASFTINGGGFGPSANVTLPTGAAFTFSSGDLFGSNGASLIADGPATFSGGRLYFGGKLTLGVHGVMTISNTSPIVVGAFQQGDGKLNILGTATVTGAGGFNVANTGEINVSGTLDVQSDADVNGDGTVRINVNSGGTLRKSAGATTMLSLPLNNAGTINVRNSTLQLAATYNQTAGAIALDGGTFAISTLDLHAGALVGTGIVDGNVINASTISPGLAASNAGQLTVTGGYTQTAAGRLKVEIGGAATNQFDRLITNTTNSTSAFAGAIDLSLINNFHPTASDTFAIAQYFSHQGEFSPVNGLDFGSGGNFTPNYQPNNLVLAAGLLTDIPGCSGAARPWVHLVAPSTFRSTNNGAFKYKTRVLYGNTGCTETHALIRVVVSNTLASDLTGLLGLDTNSVVSVPNTIFENGPVVTNLPGGQRQVAVIVHLPAYNPTAPPPPTPTPSPSPNASPIVISEFRTRGPAGPDDEFIELYNRSDSPVDLSGWKIRSSDNAGNISDNKTIDPATMIPAHGHLLIAHNVHYTDSATPDQSYTVGIADDGGIAITLPDNSIIDQLGLSPGSAFGEGASLPPMPNDSDDSYERKPGGPSGSTNDSGDNSADFRERTSAPQNTSDLPTPGGASTGTNLPPGSAAFEVEVSSPPGTGGGSRNNCDINQPTDGFADDFGIGPLLGTGCISAGTCGSAVSSAKPRGLCATDPNDKVGTGGVGVPQYISGVPPLPYAVFFENKPDATAPAGVVVITDQLDVTKYDLKTFQLGAITFGDTSVQPPAFISEYHTDVDLRPAKNVMVRVDAKLDKPTGLVTWRFASLDPATLQPTVDPLAGFLPPNQTAPEGEGSVLFLIKPKAGLASGTELRNRATIVFDQNTPIDTGDWLNTIDNDPPSSSVSALASAQSSNSFPVNWSGGDAHSGINNYNVFVSEDGGPYSVWQFNTSATSANFTGQPGKTYAFYTVAHDNTGNPENPPTNGNGQIIPDATTQVAVPSLQLSAAGYTVAEGAGHIDITVTRSANTSGAVSVTYSTADGSANDGQDYTATSGTLEFAADETSKSFPVSITDDQAIEGSETINIALSSPTGGAALGATSSAVVTITDNEGTSISGQIPYANGISPAANVTMTLTGNNGFVTRTTTTDSNGFFAFPGVPVGNDYTVTPSKTGDVNGIESLDASFVARYVSGLDIPTPNQQLAADADGDGILTSLDAALIARRVAGLPDTGIVGTWKFSPANATYSALSTEQTGQNFTAILVGDTSGNWTPALTGGGITSSNPPQSPDATLAVTVAMTHTTGPMGTNISMPITVGDLTGQGVKAYDLQVTFNPSILQPLPTAFDNAGTPSSGMLITPNANTSGHLIISAFQATDLTGSGTLINLRFMIVGQPGQVSPTTFENFTDPGTLFHPGFRFNAGTPAATPTNGSTHVNGPTASTSVVSGQIVDDGGHPVEGAGVWMMGSQNRLTVTDSQGHYRFDAVETGGFYTVTPSRANFMFSPAQRSFTQIGQQTEAVFTASGTGAGLNPLDTTEYFVRQQYLDFLGREPDEAGLNFWVSSVAACGTDSDCLTSKRADTSAAFFVSIEFQQTGYLVHRMYRAAYGDMPGTPVPLRFDEFRTDKEKIGQGVIVNQGDWEATLEANKQAYASEFIQRPRFTAVYPTTMTPTQFIDRLFLNGGVTPGDADRTAAINEFGSLTDTLDSAARARALRRVAENPILQQQEFNKAFVLMQYFGYLRRDPNTAPDTDYSGYNFWLNKLNSFNGDFRKAEMVKAFLVAGEYRGRFPR